MLRQRRIVGVTRVLSALAVKQLIFSVDDIHCGNVEVQIVYRLYKLFWDLYLVCNFYESFKVLEHLEGKLFYLHLLFDGYFLFKQTMQN